MAWTIGGAVEAYLSAHFQFPNGVPPPGLFTDPQGNRSAAAHGSTGATRAIKSARRSARLNRNTLPRRFGTWTFRFTDGN